MRLGGRGTRLTFPGNYTWSHCIGFPGTFLTNLSAAYPHQPYQNNGPQDRHLDYGDCYATALDIRQVANITMVANTPRKSGSGWASRLASNWTFSTIYTVRTGPPLTVNTGADSAENGLYVGAGSYPIPQRPKSGARQHRRARSWSILLAGALRQLLQQRSIRPAGSRDLREYGSRPI